MDGLWIAILIIALICPVSMWLMHRRKGHDGGAHDMNRSPTRRER